MKDSYKKNRDVKVELKPKALRRDFARRQINTIDSRQKSIENFRHPSEIVMDNLRHFLQHRGLLQENDTYLNNLTACLSRYCDLPENYIRIFAETDRAIESIIRSFVRPGFNILICSPVDANLMTGNRSNDVHHRSITPFMADPQGIIDSLNDQTELIYLANPNRCTGTIYDIDEIEFILDKSSGVKIILDETYYEYYGTSLAGLTRQYDNLIIVRSFSAAFGLKALPCSYILTCQENIAAVKQSNSIIHPSPAAQVAAIAALGDYEYLRKQISIVKENMTYLSVRLRGLGLLVQTTPADFLLLDVANPEQIISRLRAEGLEIRDLGHIPGLENHIALPIIDDATSASIVDTFIRMPKQYYLHPKSGKKVILRRPAESIVEGITIEESEHAI